MMKLLKEIGKFNEINAKIQLYSRKITVPLKKYYQKNYTILKKFSKLVRFDKIEN